jgi:hypothetical protein
MCVLQQPILVNSADSCATLLVCALATLRLVTR